MKCLHLKSKELAGSDAYAKGIGPVGEGIFAQRVTTEYPTSPGGNMYIGYYINTTHIDALQEHFLPGVGGSYYGLQVNYTDIYGNPLSKKMEYPDPNHSTTLEKGRMPTKSRLIVRIEILSRHYTKHFYLALTKRFIEPTFQVSMQAY